MTMSIYTYSNPYKLKSEIYWSLLKNNVQFCASQTLANGMCDIYEEFFPGKLTTIQSFINILYNNWESDVTRITQLAVVDNLIDSVDLTEELPAGMDIERLKHALKRNRQSILQAIRIMFEMDMDPDEIRYSKLTKEQKYLLLMYKELRTSNYSSFRIQRSFTQQEIEKALKETIKEAAEKSGSAQRHDISEVNTDVVVVHALIMFFRTLARKPIHINSD